MYSYAQGHAEKFIMGGFVCIFFFLGGGGWDKVVWDSLAWGFVPDNSLIHSKPNNKIFTERYGASVRFIKPYRNPVYKSTGSCKGFMKWVISKDDKTIKPDRSNLNKLEI